MCTSTSCTPSYYEYGPAMSTETEGVNDETIRGLLNDTGFCVVFILCRNKKYPFYVGVHIELLMLMFTITTLVWLRAKATSTVTNRKVVSKSPACEKRHLLLNRFIYNIANVGQMALDDIPNLILVLSNRWR
ncbi:hypothetical protein Zmor_001067 [Zophobas morio]|uniref:Uncharacterized protein n=1 Tax=Zophobas morio TaxID=2755281 RepID=A0AA38J4K3_9CUCU|nr:hypothetical protein Zmor_001067 [Zophobas morio]